jgi:hypothetical protein
LIEIGSEVLTSQAGALQLNWGGGADATAAEIGLDFKNVTGLEGCARASSGTSEGQNNLGGSPDLQGVGRGQYSELLSG